MHISKRSLTIVFLLLICLIASKIYEAQINQENGNQPPEFIYFLALQGDQEAQFSLAKRIEDAARNNMNLSEQQTFPKKLLDFSYQFFLHHQINHENAFDQFFQPIYSTQSEALKWYKAAAEQGHLNAQMVRVEYYYGAKAKQGHTAAQQVLAEYYYNNGKGPHFSQALPWISKLAQKGDAFAQSQLGWMYFSGSGIEKNYKLAHHWFLKAGLQGDRSAPAYLAWMYFHAQGVQGSNEEAFNWYKKTAEAGDLEAQMFMVVMNKFGIGTTVNPAQSAYWTEKITNTQDIDFDSVYARNDYEKRIQYLAKKNDQQPSQYRNNAFYEQYNLALDYKNASNGNKQRAFEIFNELLASHKNQADVQYQIAQMHEKGLGTAKDIHKAIEFYELSAAQNDVMALLRLGDLYFNGDEGIAQDYTKALFWYKKIEALGRQHADMKLGEIYMNGLGVERDPKKAFQYYLVNASHGNQAALKVIAHCYENGIGTPKNLKKAQEIKAKLRN